MNVAPGCFVCEPPDGLLHEKPFRWALPRKACCGSSAARLEDGTLLREAVAAVKGVGMVPEGFGMSLAMGIATLDGACGPAQGVPIFLFGTWILFESRFGAKSAFEWAAFEQPDIVTVLYVARELGTSHRGALDGFPDYMKADARRRELILNSMGDMRGGGYFSTMRIGQSIQSHRERTGRWLPSSSDELSEWLYVKDFGAPPRPDDLDASDDLFPGMIERRLAHVPRWDEWTRSGGEYP